MREQGLTLVPTRLYFKDGRVKVELAVAKGKHVRDKRRDVAEREAKRRWSGRSSPAANRYPVGNNTYGGAMVSTWSVLRLSCKRRSPVGLLKQPEPNASADNELALAA